MAKACWLGALFGVLMLLSGGVQADEEALPRVASASLCADQYILALADPAQVTSLSKHATGPLSAQAEKAQRFTTNRGALEEFLAMETDLVILDTHDAPQLRRVLPEFGIQVYELPQLNRFEDIFSQIKTVGGLLGQGVRAAKLTAELAARLDALQTSASAPKPIISYFRPDGGGAGSGTFVNEVLQAAGYENLQVTLGYDGWQGIPMEELIMTPPPGGITSFFDTSPESARSRFSSHPFYRKLSREEALFAVAGKYWPCSGPMLIDAVDTLVQARQAGFPHKKDVQ
ncbi:MAG: ABC transporter substrate-binding protein [Pseudomonadota bacterium]